MESDFLVLALAPATLALGFFAAARTESKRVALYVAVAGIALLALNAAGARTLGSGQQFAVSILGFIVLPIALSLLGYRAAVWTRRAWLALLLSPVGYFLGVAGGISAWLYFGYPI